MTTRNHRIRFCGNNFAELTSNTIAKSSELTAFPFTNTRNIFRSKVWKPSGQFLIEVNVNNEIYFNDGSDGAAAFLQGSYATPALLATMVTTYMNSFSSGWTCSYSTTTGKFTISRTSSATLQFSKRTGYYPIWDTLGFTQTSDSTGTSWVADEQRNHTSEYVIYDLGYAVPITFFSVLSPLTATFPLSSTATIKLQANNVDDWTNPPIDETLTRYDGGLFRFLDDITDTSYRYWKFSYIDRTNTLGANGVGLGYIYLGDYDTFTNRDVEYGFEKSVNDPSGVNVSEGGVLYFDSKTKYSTLKGLSLSILERANKDYLESLFQSKGKTSPFFVSLDPLGNYTTNLDELTKFVVFNEEPKFTHITRDMFTTSLSFREMI